MGRPAQEKGSRNHESRHAAPFLRTTTPKQPIDATQSCEQAGNVSCAGRKSQCKPLRQEHCGGFHLLSSEADQSDAILQARILSDKKFNLDPTLCMHVQYAFRVWTSHLHRAKVFGMRMWVSHKCQKEVKLKLTLLGEDAVYLIRYSILHLDASSSELAAQLIAQFGRLSRLDRAVYRVRVCEQAELSHLCCG